MVQGRRGRGLPCRCHRRQDRRLCRGGRSRPLAPGVGGTFIPTDLSQAGIDVRVAAVDETAVRALPDRELASLHGGHIAVRQDENRQAVPEVPVYRVAIEALTHPQVRHTIVGTAVVEAKPVRLYRLIVNFALRIFYREGALG